MSDTAKQDDRIRQLAELESESELQHPGVMDLIELMERFDETNQDTVTLRQRR